MLVPDPRYMPNWPDKVLFLAFLGHGDELLALKMVIDRRVLFKPGEPCVVERIEGWMAGGGKIELALPQLPLKMTAASAVIIELKGE